MICNPIGFLTEQGGFATERTDSAAETGGIVTDGIGFVTDGIGFVAKTGGFVTEPTDSATETGRNVTERIGSLTDGIGIARERIGWAANRHRNCPFQDRTVQKMDGAGGRLMNSRWLQRGVRQQLFGSLPQSEYLEFPHNTAAYHRIQPLAKIPP